MREVNESVLADLIRVRADRQADLDCLTFERLDPPRVATDTATLLPAAEVDVRTYADLAMNANMLAAAFIARGLEPGDHVAIVMRNHPEFVEALVAASITGVVLVPVDPRTRGERLSFLLRDGHCKGVLCGDYCAEAVEEARRAAPDVGWLLVLETGAAAADAFKDATPIAEALAEPAETVDVRLPSPTHPLEIIYTSGTTGDPKGVMWPNERFGAFGLLGYLVGYTLADRPYTGLSLAHGNAQAVTLGPSLAMGLRAVFSPSFTKSRLWEICRVHGCTTFSILGGMATAIYSEPRRPDDADNPVRLVVSAGMPAAIWRSFEERFGVDVFEWYGAVEGGLAFNPIGVGPIGAFGKPIPGLDMKILDEDDVECPPFAVGEICSRPASGEQATVEYYGNPEASEAKTRGGWLRSGDMGHSDADGWLYFDYRRAGGLRRNGDFVDPGYVEKVIAEQVGISDVSVYGVPAASQAPGECDIVAAVVWDREAVSDDSGRSASESGESARARADSLFEASRRELRSQLLPVRRRHPEDHLGKGHHAASRRTVRPDCGERLRGACPGLTTGGIGKILTRRNFSFERQDRRRGRSTVRARSWRRPPWRSRQLR
jgi:crotonobetaine/carnitine-CoA ligase